MMQTNIAPSINERVKAALVRDPKWTSVTAGLSAIILILLARIGSTGPSKASAFVPGHPAAVTVEAETPVNKVASNKAVLDWLAQPRREVDRDIFSFHPNCDDRDDISSKTAVMPQDDQE